MLQLNFESEDRVFKHFTAHILLNHGVWKRH